MSKIEIFTAVRIIPRDDEFLNRKLGARGEIFYDRDSNSLRLYDGRITGGISLAKANLTNVGLEDFRKKSVESKLATVVYNVTVTGPQSPDTGNKYNLNAEYRSEPNFVVGYTYVFDQDDATNVYFPNATGTTLNPHPLNFSADNISGELGGGTSYLADVRYFLNDVLVTQAVYNGPAFNTAASRQVQITVTNSTPATLYYWCWNHQAMGNAIAVADPGSGSGAISGGVSVSVDTQAPPAPTQGNLWLDTKTGILYVYFDDGDSEQWIQPVFPYPDISGLATETYVNTAVGNINLTGLATETYVNTAVGNINLTGLATETYVNTALSDVNLTGPGVGIPGEVFKVNPAGTAPEWGSISGDRQFYVDTVNGVDGADYGTQSSPWKTIRYSCAQITGPAALFVKAGTYTETLPITVPAEVYIVGDGVRTTFVQPAAGDEQKTMWLVSNSSMLTRMTFQGLEGYVPAANPDDIENATIGGVYVALNPDSPVTTKSPYVVECSCFSTDTGNGGAIGAVVDGSVHATGNQSILFHAYTCINDNGVGYWIKNGAKSEIVSCFTYFCHIGYASTGGGKIRALNGNNSYGVYGAVSSGFNTTEVITNQTGTIYGAQLEYSDLVGGEFATGNTITGATSGATATVTNVQTSVSKVYYKLNSATLFQNNETISNGAGVSADITSAGLQNQQGFVLVVTGFGAEPKPGASVSIAGDAFSYVIQSVSGTFVNTSSVLVLVLAQEKPTGSADGTSVTIRYEYSQVRLTGHDFLSIGTGGKTTTNYPGFPSLPASQGNEVIENYPGRVYYVTTDQDGNFRVGAFFAVDQATGSATLNANAFNLSGLTSLRLGSIGAQIGELVNEFSSDSTLSGNSNQAVPTEAAVRQYFTNVATDVIPVADNVQTLGTPTNRWQELYVGPGSINVGGIKISDVNGAFTVTTANNETLTSTININGTVGATTANTGSFTTLTNSGNLVFTGTGNRITGDFSNTTLANRVMFQTNTANTQTAVGAIPNGTSNLTQFVAFNAADMDNASFGQLRVDDERVRISSGRSGTGSFLPMTFFTSGNEQARIGTDGLFSMIKGQLVRPLLSLSVGGNTTTWFNVYPIISAFNKYYLSTHENNFEQFWEVSVGFQGTVAAIKTPNTGHTHSGDFTFRLSGGQLQIKNVSFSTGRQLYLYAIEAN